MGITLDDVIRVAKKLFIFWKNSQRKQQQQNQNQQYGGNQNQSHNYNNNNQSPYPSNNYQSNSQTYQNQSSSPYPTSNQNQQSHPAQQGWNTATGGGGGHHGGGGYGSHDGPATNIDMEHAQNPHYVQLRNQAIQEGDLMGKAFSNSKAAYNSGDGSRAHDLSMEGKEHQRRKEQLNDEAAAWIYNENNKRSPQGTFDLHGLYVQESIEYTEKAVQTGRQQGLSQIRLITGKGNHSPQAIAKLKPAIEDLMRKEGLAANLEPGNSGVLVVHLQGGGGGSREIGGGGGGDKDDCVIM